MKNVWTQSEYATSKRCMGGLIKASISYAMIGESGFVLQINNIIFKKRFDSVESAKRVADNFIEKQAKEYLLSCK